MKTDPQRNPATRDFRNKDGNRVRNWDPAETTPQLQWRALHGISVSRVMAPNSVHGLTLEPGSKGDFTGGIKEFAIFLDSLDGSNVTVTCLERKEVGSLGRKA